MQCSVDKSEGDACVVWLQKIVSVSRSLEAEVKVMYGGRNVLDLGRNMEQKGWAMRSAYLPSNNTSVFFANRSQYHRLGGYHISHPTDQCKLCGFTYIVE